MWGSQGWNQWALQPAMFNDVPHEQIDWAELAKQWIQMQQTQPNDSIPLAPPPPPLPPPPPQVVPPPVALPPPPGHVPLIPEEFPEANVTPLLLKTPVPPAVIPEPFLPERPFEKETAPAPFVPKTTDNSFWNKSQWEASAANDVDERIWTAPAVEPTAPLLAGKETFDYGHMHDNTPLAMQSIDYNHMSDFSYNQASCVYPTPAPAPAAPAPTPEAHYDQYWSQVNAAPTISPIFLKKERSTTNLQVEEEITQIDAAKRKQLPAWIRDGLEKMEQERLKRLEKERTAKEKAEKIAKMDSLKNELDTKDGSSIIPVSVKSKFDSDSEADENGTGEKLVKKISPSLKRTPSPVEDTRSEEDKKLDLMLKVRRLLTEILLSVTNSEMIEIAQEVYRKAMSKAPARQLASSTSLSSVASGLRGLASYGTESEASDQEEENASDSDEELYRRIKEKKRLFAQKEKKIIADLEKNDAEKINNDKSNERKFIKEFNEPEKLENVSDFNNSDKNDNLNVMLQPEGQISHVSPPKLSTKIEENENDKVNEIKLENKPVSNNEKVVKKAESDSSDSEESSSSHSSSESGEKRKEKSHKEMKREKPDSKKASKKDKNSSKHSNRRKRSRSGESGSSDKHRRERSRDRKSSNSKKGKKYKRSDSSSSSSSSSHRKKHSRYESSHSRREHRSHSYDEKERKRRRSISPRSHHRRDSHFSRSSRSQRYSDEKYDRKYRSKRKYDRRQSPSPGYSSKIPRKYRSSRSLSSESQSSGKKSKKYRNH